MLGLATFLLPNRAIDRANTWLTGGLLLSFLALVVGGAMLGLSPALLGSLHEMCSFHLLPQGTSVLKPGTRVEHLWLVANCKISSLVLSPLSNRRNY